MQTQKFLVSIVGFFKVLIGTFGRKNFLRPKILINILLFFVNFVGTFGRKNFLQKILHKNKHFLNKAMLIKVYWT